MGDRIRVLCISTSDSEGGAARAAYRIQMSVRELGIESKMLVKEKRTSDVNVIPLEELIPHNFFYRVFDWVRNKIKNKWQHYQWGKYPEKKPYYLSDLRSTDLCGALKKLDYDILHLHWVNQRFLPLSKLPKDKPIVWTLHDSWPFCGVCHFFLDCKNYEMECGNCPQLGSHSSKDLSHRMWKKKEANYKNLDMHIVTPSRWLGECAKESSLFGHYPVTVIPNCLDINVFRPFEEQEISPRWQMLLERSHEKPLVLYGAMDAATNTIKGFSNLLSALRVLEAEGKGDAIELVVFGADKPLEGMQVSIPIHYVGYVRDEYELVSLYNVAKVMVVPSVTEVFGQTASEALACGTPVVAFRCTGLQDVVDDNCGYLAKPFESADLAHGITWLIDEKRNRVYSAKAREKAVTCFASRVVGQSYASFYEGLYNRVSGR